MTRPATPQPPVPRPAALAAHQAGVAALQAGDCAAAAAYFSAATKADDRIAGFFANLGMALHGLGQVEAAETAYRRALALDNRLAAAHNSLGTALQDLGRLTEAEAAFRAALSLNGDYHEAQVNLAATLHAQQRWDEAAALLLAALSRNPADAVARVNLAAVYKETGRTADAEAQLLTALQLEPDEPQALINLALVREKQGQFAAAEALYRQVLAAAADLPLPSWNLALLLLRQGRLAEGLPLYEARFAARPDPRFAFPPLPRWRGESLNGRKLLVWREQGLGDNLMFGVLAPRLAMLATAQGGQVVVAAEPRLTSLFARALPDAMVVAAPLGPPLQAHGADMHCPLGTLPLLLSPQLSGFTDLPTAWLAAEPGRLARWRTRLAALGPGLKIGVAWRSAFAGGERGEAYLQLADLAPLAAVAGVQLINLQYDFTAAEAAGATAALGAPLHVWADADLRHDLETAAALTAACDLVISVASSVGEMAAVLGVPVWRLGAADWTTLGAAVRPWFPAMQVWAPRAGERLADVVRRAAWALNDLRDAPAMRMGEDRQAAECAGLAREAQALATAGQADRAALAWWGVILRAPGDGDAFAGLANVRAGQGRHPQALRALDRALTLDPHCAEWRYNQGNSLRALGRAAAADAAWAAAAALNPALALADFNRGYAALERGDLAAGWDGLERRFAAGQARPNRVFSCPQWQGEPLNGGALLIWREQGVGDELMFAACYTDAIAAAKAAGAGRVWIDAEPRLARLLSRRFAGDGDFVQAQAWAEGDPPPPTIAAHLPAGSLPTLLRRSLAAFPVGGAPPLIADPALNDLWRDRLAALPPGLRLGICWRTGLRGPQRTAAITALSDWGALLTLPGVRLINLQYDDCAAELAAAEQQFGVTIHRWEDLDLRQDLDAVAALTANLDLVVSVGTSVAEMAGALGVPVWRLGPLGDWASLGTGCRPWHAAMQLFPPPAGQPLAAAVALAVRALTNLRPPPRPEPASEAQPPKPPEPPKGKPAELLERGMALHRAGQLDRAAAHYAAIPRGKPQYPDARHLLGMIDCAAGRYGAALALFDQAIAGQGRAADYHANRAVALHGLTRHEDAATAARRALSLRRDHAEAANTLGNALAALGRWEDALAAYQQALAARPTYAEAALNQGVALAALNRRDAAAALLRPALAALPTHGPGRGAWADLLRRQGDFAAARRQYRILLALQPDHPAAWEALGGVEADSPPIPDPARPAAVICWTRAARLAPSLSAPWGRLGAAHRLGGREDAARRAFRHALALTPGQADALSNLALAEPAGKWFARALAVNPQDGAARFNRGVMRLQKGDLTGGWADYDGRLTAAALFPSPGFSPPVWAGESLAGRHILVWREQGLGDELMFAALYPALIRQAGRVTLACDPRLVGLFARSFPAARYPDLTIRALADCLADPGLNADYQAAAGSLSRYLAPSLAGYAADAGVLRADPARLAVFKQRLAGLRPGLRLGIAWTSGRIDTGRQRAYAPLTDWRPLLTLPGVTAVSLQYDGRPDEIAAVNAGLPNPVAAFPDVDLKNNLEDAAALTAACDLVISVASSVGEMAGALGVPVWRLGGRDWTWLGAGTRPWHPSMRVIAPPAGESLAGAIARAAHDLRRLTGAAPA